MKVLKIDQSSVDQRTGALVAVARDVPLGPDPDADAPTYDNTLMACALGLTAVPYPATDDGYCEAIVEDSVDGLDAVIVGARDLRTAKIVGNVKPGETILHSTGPQQAAQCQLKEDKRQAVLLTKDSREKTVLLMLDGANDKIQISGFGLMFEMSKQQGIVLSSGGAQLILKDGNASLTGNVTLGGNVHAPTFKPMLGPPSGSPGGPASVPMVAAKNVSISIGITLLWFTSLYVTALML